MWLRHNLLRAILAINFWRKYDIFVSIYILVCNYIYTHVFGQYTVATLWGRISHVRQCNLHGYKIHISATPQVTTYVYMYIKKQNKRTQIWNINLFLLKDNYTVLHFLFLLLRITSTKPKHSLLLYNKTSD